MIRFRKQLTVDPYRYKKIQEALQQYFAEYNPSNEFDNASLVDLTLFELYFKKFNKQIYSSGKITFHISELKALNILINHMHLPIEHF